MINVCTVSSMDELKELRAAYEMGLPFAQDLNIEENIWDCRYYKLEYDSRMVGYACIDSVKTLWEFYLADEACIHGQEIFKYLIDGSYITAAECKTYDYLLLSMCHDYQKSAEGSAYLFRDYVEPSNNSKTRFEEVTFRMARMEDYECLEELNRIDGEVDFFHNLKGEISNQEVLIFLKGANVVGAGTFKMIWKNWNYRDIGMVVAKDYRRQGIGTFILLTLKEYCQAHDFIPVAGCWYYNLSSKRTLERAGFISKHRVLRFIF